MLLLNKNAREVIHNILISIKYNQTLPKVKSRVEKHWHILKFKEIFLVSALIAFRRSANLKKIIGRNAIKSNQKLIISIAINLLRNAHHA